MVNLGPSLLMLCSCDGVVSECEVTGDLQVDPDVALKLSYRPSRSGVSKQTSKPLFGVNKKPGLVLAKGVLEYPHANGHISTSNTRRACLESLEDDWSVVCGLGGC